MLGPDYIKGYRAGYAQAFKDQDSPDYDSFALGLGIPSKSKPKRRQSKKQKLLSDMAGKAWARYKKGSGKKTYIQIRAQVSRSAEYKRKAKKL